MLITLLATGIAARITTWVAAASAFAFDFVTKSFEATLLARIDRDVYQGQSFSGYAFFDFNAFHFFATAFVDYADSF